MRGAVNGGFTVRVAVLLVTEPLTSVTVAAKTAPLSASVVGAVVYVVLLAPVITTPFFIH